MALRLLLDSWLPYLLPEAPEAGEVGGLMLLSREEPKRRSCAERAEPGRCEEEDEAAVL